MRAVAVASFAAALLLTGCGPSTGSSSSKLEDAVGAGSSQWALLDLSNRSIVYARTLDDLTTNPDYRDRVMVFRRVGSDNARFLVGAFEVTQAQWRRITGDEPWTAVPTAVVAADAHADDKPAYNLDYETLVASLAAYPLAGGGRLSMPSATQWRTAAGVSSGYVWGPDADRAAVRSHALVRESAISEVNKGVRLVGGIDVGGPDAVGVRAGNVNGLHDMHGNVWEWLAPGDRVIGGSWYDTVSLARAEVEAGAGEGLASDVDHALIGARLVLIP